MNSAHTQQNLPIPDLTSSGIGNDREKVQKSADHEGWPIRSRRVEEAVRILNPTYMYYQQG